METEEMEGEVKKAPSPSRRGGSLPAVGVGGGFDFKVTQKTRRKRMKAQKIEIINQMERAQTVWGAKVWVKSD